jgi:hypothetical protein
MLKAANDTQRIESAFTRKPRQNSVLFTNPLFPLSTKIQKLTEDALDVFWYFFAKHFPEAKYGDLSPLTTIRLTEAATSAVNEWVWAKVPRGRRKKTAQRSRPSVTHSPGPWFLD